MNTQIQEAARKWWLSLDLSEQIIKYGNGNSLFNPSENEIVSIWIQEVVMKWVKTKGKNYFIFENSIPFTPEEFASMYLKEHESKEVSNYVDTDKIRDNNAEFSKEEPVSVSVEEAANEHPFFRNRKQVMYMKNGLSESDFNEFAEESDAIIGELLESLKDMCGRLEWEESDYLPSVNFHKAKSAINTATNYINQQ